ncbi:MAG: cytochrome C [Bacteroidetes bacterium]|nr:MAG: cytochrome C [Bacteroidota bacterium]
MLKKYLKWTGIALLVALVVIQFFGIDKTNPPADPEQAFDRIEQPPEEVFTLIKHACYDCHSNHTTYPWYTSVQPLGWWIAGHIDHAREELNFSEWGTYSSKKKQHKMEEAAEEVAEKHMPLKSYTWMHPKARLSEEERQMLVDWFKSKSEESVPS